MKKIKKPISILLAVLMVFSVFAVVPFTASAAEQDGLYMNDLHVNRTMSGDGWSFDSSRNILTLNNYQFSGIGRNPTSGSSVIMYYPQDKPLTIVLKGSNTIVQEGDPNKDAWWGIYSKSDLVITGDGTLNVSTKDGGGRGAAIYGEKNITIIGTCTVKATCGTVTTGPQNNGICQPDDATLAADEKANVTITGPNGISSPVAAVTNGATTMNYYRFNDALNAWTDGTTLTLLADVQTSSTINVSGTKILDLNGYGIKTAGGVAITVNDGANLTMKDSAPTRTDTGINRPNGVVGGYLTGYNGGNNSFACVVINAGKFTMDGGSITGNISSANGAGVWIDDKAGEFVMNGGFITNNRAGIGAGFYGWGKVTMTGGIVSDNVSTSAGALSGGMLIHGSLTMTGGTITRNTVGVKVWQKTSVVNLSGNARITDNTVDGTAYGNLDMTDGQASQNCVKVTGTLGDEALIGITMKSPGVFTNTDSADTSYNDPTKFFSDNSNYIVGKNADGQLLLGVPRTVTWKNGETVLKTEKVVKGTTPQYTGADPTKEDDDNAYTFTGWDPALAPVNDDTIYTAQFTATPYVASVTTAGGTTTTKYTDFNAALNAWTNETTLTLLSDIVMTTGQSQGDGTISGISVSGEKKTLDLNGKTLSLASSVSVKQERVIDVTGGGDLTIKDSSGTNAGKITGASPTGDNGWSAGLYINRSGTATMYGGTITGNTTKHGAGVWIDGRGVGGIFNMHGGVITGNTAEWGGGVYVGCKLDGDGNKGYFNMFGGTITGNTATVNGSDNVYNSYYGVTTHTGGTIDGGYVDSRNEYVTVFFDANDGSGTMSAQYVKKNTATTIKKNENYDNKGAKTEPAFTREGYTFAGWNTEPGGTGFNYTAGKSNLYINNNTILYANWKPKTLIAGHSLSLDGNIGINFYLDPSVAGLTAQEVNAGNLSYTFAWANGNPGKAKVDVAAQSGSTFVKDGELIKVTCHVCAAEMTCDVIASFKLGDQTQIETYSVRQYCDESVIGDGAEYSDDTKLVTLVEAMLNYGAMAQTKFKVNTGTPGSSDTPGTPGKLANEGVTYNPGDVTTAMLEKAIADANGTETADDMNNVAATLGAKWFSTSLIYLDNSTLRHYFVKANDTFNPSDYTGKKSNYYYYVEVTGIPAAELDNLQTFMESNTEKSFKYSPLDFVKDMIEYSADEASVNLAKSLYWYNQAANEYFV